MKNKEYNNIEFVPDHIADVVPSIKTLLLTNPEHTSLMGLCLVDYFSPKNEWKGYDPKEQLPPKKEGWNHSERVLVYYKDESGFIDWSIAYYHYKPPFKKDPEWIDFQQGNGGCPYRWFYLPKINN